MFLNKTNVKSLNKWIQVLKALEKRPQTFPSNSLKSNKLNFLPNTDCTQYALSSSSHIDNQFLKYNSKKKIVIK